jgi:ADP-ribose pyrophosphatase YjhB (NUDIX family)
MLIPALLCPELHGKVGYLYIMENRFNVRVYGICIANDKLLVNEEIIRGKKIIKLPGGGLNWGEGTIDCLKREWKEELNIDIDVAGHFYTTDFFQPSAYDNSQVISIYYTVTAEIPGVILNTESNERTYWMDLKDISADTFTLAIDKVVGGMLHQLYSQN